MASNKLAKAKPTDDEIIRALWKTGGLLKHASQELDYNIEDLKNVIRKSKSLRKALFTVRESCLDEVEKTLLARITGGGDISKIKDNSGILTMFYLKCLGKHRGWIDRPDKAGDSVKKPLYIKIMPVGVVEEKTKKRGRPKKIYAEAKVLPAPTLTEEEKSLEEIMDGEILD